MYTYKNIYHIPIIFDRMVYKNCQWTSVKLIDDPYEYEKRIF